MKYILLLLLTLEANAQIQLRRQDVYTKTEANLLLAKKISSESSNKKTCFYTLGGAGSTPSTYTTMTTVIEVIDECGMSTGPARSAVGEYTLPMTGWAPNTFIWCEAQSGGGGSAHPTSMTYSDGSGAATLSFRGRGNSYATIDPQGIAINCTGER